MVRSFPARLHVVMAREAPVAVVFRKGPSKCVCTVFDRPLAHGWVLRKIAHAQVGAPAGKGCYWDEHELHHESTGTVIAHPDWEWADVDGESLVWASGGCLFRASFDRASGAGNPRLLHDFNPMHFEAIEAPY